MLNGSDNRPQSQCGSCRVKRQTGTSKSHHSCKCGSEPPKSYIEKYELQFPDGLELHFGSNSNINAGVLQVQIQQKASMTLVVIGKDGNEKEVDLVPTELKIIREELSAQAMQDACMKLVLANLSQSM